MFQAKKSGDSRFKIVEIARIENFNSPERIALREYDRLRAQNMDVTIKCYKKFIRCILQRFM